MGEAFDANMYMYTLSSLTTTILLIIGMDLNNIVMVGRMDQLISHSVQYRQEAAIPTISM